MRFVAVQNRALEILNQFRSHNQFPQGRRIELCEAAVDSQTRHLTEEFRATKKQDQDSSDLDRTKNVVHTFRGPSAKEWLERDVETKTQISGTPTQGHMLRHELDTLKGENEPYQELFDFAQFDKTGGGIRHITIAILGDGGVGCGAIVTKTEFLTPEPGKSWREESQMDFLAQGILGVYQQGTCKPQI